MTTGHDLLKACVWMYKLSHCTESIVICVSLASTQKQRVKDMLHGLLALLELLLCPDRALCAIEAPSKAACCSHEAPTDSLCSVVGCRYQYAARLSAPARGPSSVTACPLLAPTLEAYKRTPDPCIRAICHTANLVPLQTYHRQINV